LAIKCLIFTAELSLQCYRLPGCPRKVQSGKSSKHVAHVHGGKVNQKENSVKSTASHSEARWRRVDPLIPHVIDFVGAKRPALMGFLRPANRLGRGYSFEVLRAKVPLTRSCHELERAAFERMLEGLSMGRMTASLMVRGDLPARFLGGPINLGDRTRKAARKSLNQPLKSKSRFSLLLDGRLLTYNCHG